MTNDEPADYNLSASVSRSIIALAQASIDRATNTRPEAAMDDGAAGSNDSSGEFVAGLVRTLSQRKGTASDRQVQDSGTSEAPVVPNGFPANVHFGRFRLIRVLGHGGFGVVLLAFDPRLQREVALKLPRPELLSLGDWRKRFQHEARAAAALEHPSIVPVFDIGHVGPVWYIASAFVDGPTLNEWRHDVTKRRPRLAIELVAQVAAAVQHAHSRGILHRDLKPANILLRLPTSVDASAAPTALVTDFGLASRVLPHDAWRNGPGPAGTLAYMAPEQTYDGQSGVGTAADIYAMGAILFELLTGRPPFLSQDAESLIEQIRRVPAPLLRSLSRDAAHDLEAICAKCLAKCSTDRYESAADLARDLRRFLSGNCVDARRVGLAHRTLRWAKQRPATAALAAALLLAVCGGGALSLREWQRAETNLRQAEQAIVNLGWAIDDAVFWQSDSDRYGPEQRNELTRRYAALLQQFGDQPAARPVQAAAECFYARMDVLDGKVIQAKEKFGSSISQWQALVLDNPSDMFSRRALAKTLYCYGTFLVTDDKISDGLAHFEGDRLFGYFDANRGAQVVMQDYADILFEKAEALRQRDIDAEAATHYIACMEVCRRLAAANPGNADAQFRRLQAQMRLGLVHRPAASRESMYATRMAALERLRPLVRQYPDLREYGIEHANAAFWIAKHAERLGHKEVIDEFLAEAVTSFERALVPGDCPLEVKHKYAEALRFKALRHAAMSQVGEALESANVALKQYRAMGSVRECSELSLANAHHAIAGVYLRCGTNADAIRTLEQASELFETAVGDAPRNRGVHLRESDVWAKLSSLYEESGHTAEALIASQRAVRVLEAWRGITPDEPHVAKRLIQLRSTVSRLKEI